MLRQCHRLSICFQLFKVDFAFGVKFLLFLTLGVCALLVVLVDRVKALITSVRISRMFSKSLDFPGFFLQLLWFSNTLHVNLIKGGWKLSCVAWQPLCGGQWAESKISIWNLSVSFKGGACESDQEGRLRRSWRWRRSTYPLTTCRPCFLPTNDGRLRCRQQPLIPSQRRVSDVHTKQFCTRWQTKHQTQLSDISTPNSEGPLCWTKRGLCDMKYVVRNFLMW